MQWLHLPAVHHMVEHVLTHLESHRTRLTASCLPPLFVGVQGPQGSGKTFLTSRLRSALEHKGVRAVVMSIDDLYLTHDGLVEVAGGSLSGSERTGNALLKGRGLPGTHDISLGREVLSALKAINNDGGRRDQPFELPSFDKSLFSGEGDRLPRTEGKGSLIDVPPVVDVVILEGWCVGFYPVSDECLKRRWTGAKKLTENDEWEEGLSEADVASIRELKGVCDMPGVTRTDVEEVNEKLKEYLDWWEMLDAFIQIKPPEHSPYGIIYKWRLQQEHDMKSQNGGRGMSDEQVKRFVDRYIPGYVFFRDGVTNGLETDLSSTNKGKPRPACPPSWTGKGLIITIGDEREVVGVHSF